MDAHSLAEFTESAVAFERLIRRAILRLADELEMTADDLPGDLAPVHAEPPKSRYCEADARYYGLTPGFDLPRPLPIEVRIDQLGRAMQRAVTIRRTLAALQSSPGTPGGTCSRPGGIPASSSSSSSSTSSSSTPTSIPDHLSPSSSASSALEFSSSRASITPPPQQHSDADENHRLGPPALRDALAQPRRAFSPTPDSPQPETAPEADRRLGPQALRDSLAQPRRPLPPVTLTFPDPPQSNPSGTASRHDSAPRLLPILPPAPFLAPAARQTPAALSQALQKNLSDPTLHPCGTGAPAGHSGALSSAPAGHSSGSTASSQPAPNDDPGAVSSAPAGIPGPPNPSQSPDDSAPDSSPYADFPPLTPAEQRIADRARRHHFPDGAPPDLHPRFGLKYIPDDVIRRRHADTPRPTDFHWVQWDDDTKPPP